MTITLQKSEPKINLFKNKKRIDDESIAYNFKTKTLKIIFFRGSYRLFNKSACIVLIWLGRFAGCRCEAYFFRIPP